MTEKVIRQTNARSNIRRVIVVKRRAIRVARQSRQMQAVHAGRIDERKLPSVCERWIEIADMAKIVMKRAEYFRSHAQVQCQIRPNLPIILREHRVVIGPVFVIRKAAAAEAELWRAQKKILEVGGRNSRQRSRSYRCIREEQFPVEHLRKVLVQIHSREVATETEHVCAFYPAHGVHKVVIVLVLRLVPEGGRSDFKSRALENEFINGVRHAVRRPVDSQVRRGDGWNVGQIVVNMHEAESELIHECG